MLELRQCLHKRAGTLASPVLASLRMIRATARAICTPTRSDGSGCEGRKPRYTQRTLFLVCCIIATSPVADSIILELCRCRRRTEREAESPQSSVREDACRTRVRCCQAQVLFRGSVR